MVEHSRPDRMSLGVVLELGRHFWASERAFEEPLNVLGEVIRGKKNMQHVKTKCWKLRKVLL